MAKRKAQSSSSGGGGPSIGDSIKDFGEKYKKAQADLGRFNLVIHGKTGAGKSTLINAIFSANVARVGNGRPVTAGVDYYEHPSGVFGVYDSQGIETGEASADVVQKLEKLIDEKRKKPLEDQIHVCWYCVRAGDRRFEDSQAEFVRALAKHVPVMLVLTQVPKTSNGIHPEAQDLANDIERRELPLRPSGQAFLTMAIPDEHLGQESHGLEELLAATFEVAPDGVSAAIAATQKLDLSVKAREARKAIAPAAAAAVAAGATPIPFSDAALLVPIQIGMMAAISAAFGLDIEVGVLATMAGAALSAGGVTAAGKYAVTNLLKFVPGGNVAGMAIRGTVAGGLTAAVGEAWIGVCRQLYSMGPGAAVRIPKDQVRQMFVAELKKRGKGK